MFLRARSSLLLFGARNFSVSPSAPVIDLEPLFPLMGPDEKLVNGGARADTIHQIKRACTETGFFFATAEKTVPLELINKVYSHSKAFHALPDEVKRPYHVKLSPISRGWVPRGEEPSYEPGTVSTVESFDMARDLPSDHPAYIAGVPELGPNVWPSEDIVPNFKRDLRLYYEATTKVAEGLFQALAISMGLPHHDTLRLKSTELARSSLRLLYYAGAEQQRQDPTVAAAAAPAAVEVAGISTHTDFECFTLLHQNARGLELVDVQGNWVMPDRYDCFACMLGDVVERWTNGEWKATKHRVPHLSSSRQSLVRFNGCDGATVIQPLSPFVGGGVVAKYPPVTQADHLAAEMAAAEQNRLDLIGKVQ